MTLNQRIYLDGIEERADKVVIVVNVMATVIMIGLAALVVINFN